MSKLEQPNGTKTQRTYTITNNGVYLRKGEEMGMFEMGSTVVLLFECPESTTISRQPGEKVRLGEPLLEK